MRPLSRLGFLRALALVMGSCLANATLADSHAVWSAADVETITSMRWSQSGPRPADPSNAHEGSADAARLGRRLFEDAGLSRSGEVSCASCHVRGMQFQDGRPTGKGVGLGRRRTMPVMGADHAPFLFWDGRKDSLWSQALGPMEDGLEHGGNRVELVRRVQARHLGDYQRAFGKLPKLGPLSTPASPVGTATERAAWASLPVAQRDAVNRVFANMGKAIAAYERTLTYGPSRFDRYAEALAGGRDTSGLLTPREARGLRLFLHEGQCATCHSGPQFSDHAFHNTGVPAANPRAPDRGRAEGAGKLLNDEFNCLGRYSDARAAQCAELQFLDADDPSQLGAFRTPSLRNVAVRAPYMHAGQFATLQQVLRHYARSPAAPIGSSELLRPGAASELRTAIRLDEPDLRDLEAFLGTLTGPVLSASGATSP